MPLWDEYLLFDLDGPGGGSPYTLGYDDAGNLTSDPSAPNWGDPSGPSGQEYVYDAENRLVEVIRASDDETLIEYEYDALGRRIHTIEYYDTDGDELSPPRVTRHVYFGMEVIEEYIIGEDEYSQETDTLAREFIWGDTARFPEPAVMVDHTDAGNVAAGTAEVLHYLHDVLGSVVALIDENGEIVERYTYDPYGQTFIEEINVQTFPPSVTPVDTSQFGNPFRWTGQRYDETVGLYSFFFRHYTPRHGRWLQRDPLEHAAGSVNFYEYAMGSPMMFVDPLGLCTLFTQPQISPPRELLEERPVSPGPGFGVYWVKELWNRLMEMCKNECAPGAQGNERYSGNVGRCMAGCKAEARRMLKQIKSYLKKTQGRGGYRDCTRWSKRLNALLRRMNLKFFKFAPISLLDATRPTMTAGHVVLGLTNASSTASATSGGTSYQVWDLLLDFTKWNNTEGDTWYIMAGGRMAMLGMEPAHAGKILMPYGPELKPKPGSDFYGESQGGSRDDPWPKDFPAW